MQKLGLNEACETSAQCEGMVYSTKTGYLPIVCKEVAGRKICTCPDGFDHKSIPGSNSGACISQGEQSCISIPNVLLVGLQHIQTSNISKSSNSTLVKF